jgi:hypothetical protein
MAGIMKDIPVFHLGNCSLRCSTIYIPVEAFGAVQETHVKIRSRRIFEPVSGFNTTPDQPIKKAGRKNG